MRRLELDRRRFLASAGAIALGASLPAPVFAAGPAGILTSTIPSTGETIAKLGMGTWITFNVGDDPELRAARAEVLRTFFEMGGGMVDSSPMYGSSEAVIGYCLDQIKDTSGLFSATKVWTPLQSSGPGQMRESFDYWGIDRFNLLQVHNLVNWEGHLETLKQWKAEDRVRHIGVTTSHGRRHDEFARVMRSEPLDFVQFTYNIVEREAENRLLPLAADRGQAVIINRPFRRKELINRFEGYPLPDFASEIDAKSWPQFLLKFIISHPNVTCAIPATSRVDHMRENMNAARGPLPDPGLRKRMIEYVETL